MGARQCACLGPLLGQPDGRADEHARVVLASRHNGSGSGRIARTVPPSAATSENWVWLVVLAELLWVTYGQLTTTDQSAGTFFNSTYLGEGLLLLLPWCLPAPECFSPSARCPLRDDRACAGGLCGHKLACVVRASAGVDRLGPGSPLSRAMLPTSWPRSGGCH